jgi:hypothetical protein
LVEANWTLACTDEIVRVPVPPLVTVTCCAALVVPVACTPKKSDVGERLITGATPVPVSATVCVEILPPKFAVSVPVRVPVAVGVNTTLMSHF